MTTIISLADQTFLQNFLQNDFPLGIARVGSLAVKQKHIKSLQGIRGSVKLIGKEPLPLARNQIDSG